MPGHFHKPFRVKSHSKLKATERKQFVELLRRRFGEIDDQRLFGGVKYDLFKSKVVTHAEQTMFLYFCGQQPLFFEADGLLQPSVYALWRQPGLLTRLVMADSLLPVLQKGADLMVPGLVPPSNCEPGPRMFGRFEKGAACCLASDRLGCALATGRANLSAEDLFACGGHGRAVLVDHVVGDQLWEKGDRTEPAASDTRAEGEEEEEKEEEEEQKDEDKKEEDEEAEEEEGAVGVTAEAEAEAEAEADAHFLNCFLHSLRHRVKDKDLPLLCSSLLGGFMSPYSPSPLNVRRTRYRKFGAFLEAMRDEGLVQVANSKGVLSITWVDRSHPMLLAAPQPPLEWRERAQPTAEFVPMGIEEVYFVTAPTAEVFRLSGHCKGACLTGKQVRQLVTDYVKARQLQAPENPKEVRLDRALSSVASNSKEYRLMDSLTWDRLFQVFYSAMTAGYRVSSADGRVLLERRGRAPKVTLRVESRANRKEMSVVSCLADYGVDLAEFCRCVQKALSVNAAAQSSGDVNVQGNQLVFLSRLLTTKYNISKKCIAGYVAGKK